MGVKLSSHGSYCYIYILFKPFFSSYFAENVSHISLFYVTTLCNL